jgi:hypothetical protein
MKYFAISFLFLLNNEIMSLITLIILAICFVSDIVKERCV